MIKRNLIFLVLLLAVITGLAYIKYQQIQEGMAMMAAGAPPPSTVEAIPAQILRWQPRVSAVGTLTAREGIDLRNEVAGVVKTVHFESGHRVAAGDLLVSLADEVEQADLQSIKAQEELAQSQFTRNKNMWKKKTISETAYDNARSNLLVAKANVEQIQARIAKKSIRAPFAGVLGIKQISTGQYVALGTMLVSLQNYNQLFTDFSVSERYFPEISPGQQVQFRVSAYGEKIFVGKVLAVDVKVNELTRNISVRAELTNTDGLLRPGMYTDIDLILSKQSDTIVVPATSVVYSSFGDALFVVEENDKGQLIARQVLVTTGEQRGDLVAIASGLQGDELVVQAGIGKLRNNSPVVLAEQVRLKGSE
jgi:membrane fusion protein (multidrug efflux system)